MNTRKHLTAPEWLARGTWLTEEGNPQLANLRAACEEYGNMEKIGVRASRDAFAFANPDEVHVSLKTGVCMSMCLGLLCLVVLKKQGNSVIGTNLHFLSDF